MTELSPKRKGRLTGSRIGAALGLNPWKAPDDLIREMVREHHGADPEFTGNVATEYGTAHEPIAMASLEMELGVTIEPCEFVELCEYFGATPDGLLAEYQGIEGDTFKDGLIEIKCPYSQRENSPPEFKSIEDQPHYYAQVQLEMQAAKKSWCLFYQWAPHGSREEIVTVDKDWIEEHTPVAMAFMERLKKELKNPDHLLPKRPVIDNENVRKLVAELDEVRDQIDFATARQKEIMAELVRAANERDALVCGRKLTRVERAGSVSYASVVKDHAPDVDLEPYRGKPSVSWRLS